jgi:predicted esterase
MISRRRVALWMLAAAAVSVPPAASGQEASPRGEIAPPHEATPPALPDGVQPGREVRVPVPGDRSAIVVHAPAGNREAVLYLHGVCGDVYAIRTWSEAASRHGTLIAMLGDDPCDGRQGRFRWYNDLGRLDARIRRTLEAVAKARGGQLETEQVTIVGYSQGADRAERLAARFPSRYPRVLLGSPPDAPKPESFTQGQAIAIVAGAKEDNARRRNGARELEQAGLPSLFVTLPDAFHGQFGPEGDRVMGEALSWLLGRR